MKSTRLAFAILVCALVPSIAACSAPAGGADGSAASADETEATPLPNFVKVRDGLYRGGHPSAAGLDYLKSIGIQTIVDLEIGDFVEATPWSISAEVSGAADRGITLVREPMSAFEPALSDDFDSRVNAALAILKDRSQGPVYVHCAHGQDRTGLIIGLERVLIENWAPSDAHAEMLQRGFHTGFIGLDDYFDRKTGWDGN